MGRAIRLSRARNTPSHYPRWGPWVLTTRPCRASRPRPCAQSPRMSGFGPKTAPGTSQHREVDLLSPAPGVSLYPSSSWGAGRRRRGKRGGKARPELPKSRGGGAQGTLRARAAGRKPGHDPFPSACSRGASSPGNPPCRSQPGEQRVWEARSGSEKRGGGRQEGRRWGQGRAPACTSSLSRMMESSTLQAPH